MRQSEDRYPSRVGGCARMESRRDPVVYRDWTSAAPVTLDQWAFFRDNGYLVLERLFNDDETAALEEEAAILASGARALEPETAIAEPGSDALRSIFRIHRQSATFARLASDSRLVSHAQFLLDDDVYIHQSRLNYKPGFNGKEFYWHSDFETWHVEDGMPAMRAISMSVLLTDNLSVNGPTMFVPGSHRRFIACVGETPEDHYRESLRKQEYGVPDSEILARIVAEKGVAMPTAPAGSVVLFDCNTMHGSNSNITPYPRANAFIVYNAVSNRLVAPFGPEKPRPEFIAARADVEAVAPVTGRIERRHEGRRS